MDLTLLLALAILVLMLPGAVLIWFVVGQLRKSRELFRKLASRLDGTTTSLPFGLRYEIQNLHIRVYALQGSVQYRARVRLRTYPGILVTRKISRLKFLDSLNYSPSRQTFTFRAEIDEAYGFRAKDRRWMREIFTRELQARLSETDRVRRIQISKRGMSGAILLFSNSEEEHEKASRAVDILNEVSLQLSRSTLAL